MYIRWIKSRVVVTDLEEVKWNREEHQQEAEHFATQNPKY